MNEIRVFETLPSTNAYLKDLARKAQCYHGLAIQALDQTQGRGRSDHSFFSPYGGVYISIALEIDEDCLLLTGRMAVALRRAIRNAFGLDTQIKWLNDLYFQGKKVAGILAEVAQNFVVVGMGLNLEGDDFPTGLRDKATSLFKPGRCPISAVDMGEVIVDSILNLDVASCLEEYRKNCFIIGKNLIVNSSHRYEAKALEVLDDYSLKVIRPDNQTETLSAGEVSIRF